MTRLKPADRGVGYVPQDAALFPTLNVRDHLAFALDLRGWDRDAITLRVGELSEMLGLRCPTSLTAGRTGLSGGGAQLARRWVGRCRFGRVYCCWTSRLPRSTMKPKQICILFFARSND